IRSATGGEGVDVVLNSLAGEAMVRSIDVLRPFGRFLELGKRDFYENSRIGLRPFRNNISYFGIDADQLMDVSPQLTAALFTQVMALLE
ncbi:zinc-binding dehydrogenase, partial [Escherichia coli]